MLGCRGQLGQDLLAAATSDEPVEAQGLDRSRLDLRDVDSLAEQLAGIPFDILVNCAAFTKVDAAEVDPATAFTVNAYAVEALAACCADRGAMFFHVSTDYVFNGETDRPYLPDDSPGPLNVYGASKLVGEVLARNVYPRTIIVRTSSVFGVAGAQPEGGGNFVETVLRLGRERGQLRVVADNLMAPTFSADLAHGLLQLMCLRPEPGIYHLTNGGQTSWHGLAVAALEMTGISAEVVPIRAVDYPTPARRPRFSVLDTRKATALCGPVASWEDALRRYLALRSVG